MPSNVILISNFAVGEKIFPQKKVVSQVGVLTFLFNQKMLFIPGEDSNYLIDTERKLLKKIDLSQQISLLKEKKESIGEFQKQIVQTEYKILGYESRIIKSSAVNPLIHIRVESHYIIIPELQETAWHKHCLSDQRISLHPTETGLCDVVAKLNIEISTGGNRTVQNIELQSVNFNSPDEGLSEYVNYAKAN